MAKRGNETIETEEFERKRFKWIETQMMKKYTISVCTLAGSTITLSDVLGVTCLSYVRRHGLRELRRLFSSDEFKGRSEWEYFMVHGSTVLPSSREDFKNQKHYVYKYLDTEDTICLIRTGAPSTWRS